jgi:hypothetical protein
VLVLVLVLMPVLGTTQKHAAAAAAAAVAHKQPRLDSCSGSGGSKGGRAGVQCVSAHGLPTLP